MFINNSKQSENGHYSQKGSARTHNTINNYDGLLGNLGYQMLAQQNVVTENAASLFNIKNVSNEIFKEYDKLKLGEITDMSVGQMMRDIYKLLNKEFYPTPQDIAEFKQLLDIDDDDKLMKSDIETSVTKYLGMVQGLSDGNQEGLKKQPSLKEISRNEFSTGNDMSHHSFPNFGENYNDQSYYKSINQSPYVNYSKYGTFDFGGGQETN